MPRQARLRFLFPSLPLDVPQPWKVTYLQLKYPGEVVVADRWETSWGELLPRELFFRVVFLTAPARLGTISIADSRIAVCAPSCMPIKPIVGLAKELHTVSETKGAYITGQGQKAALLRQTLQGREKELFREGGTLYSKGSVTLAPGIEIDRERVFLGSFPPDWVQALASALLARQYPSLPVSTAVFSRPFAFRDAQKLLEGLLSPHPDEEARIAVRIFAPGLSLGDFNKVSLGTNQLLAFIHREVEKAPGPVSISHLLDALCFRQGLPSSAAMLYFLLYVFLAHPGVEVELRQGHSIQLRSGQALASGHIYREIVPDLSWDEGLLSSFLTLHRAQAPGWGNVRFYAFVIDPALRSISLPADEAWGLFQRSLSELHQGLSNIQHGLISLSADLEQPVPEGVGRELDRLERVAGSPDLSTFYYACRQEFLIQSDLEEAMATYRRLGQFQASFSEIASAAGYLKGVCFGKGHKELVLDHEILQGQLNLQAFIADPSLWPNLRTLFDWFCSRYKEAYLGHNASYHKEAAALWSRLERVKPQVEALKRLNSLSVLGPPVGTGLSQQLYALSPEIKVCSLGPKEISLKSVPICPSCSLPLDQEVPLSEVELFLSGLEQAIREQNRRLGSHAVRQVLAQSGEMVDKFLKIVQASDLSSLSGVLDDEVMEFLRSFIKQP